MTKKCCISLNFAFLVIFTAYLHILFNFSIKFQMVLNIANLYGYIKCRRDAKAKVQGAVGNFLGRQLFNQVLLYWFDLNNLNFLNPNSSFISVTTLHNFHNLFL